MAAVFAFGLVLPYEDLYIPAGDTRATVSTRVYLKTNTAEDSTPERQVKVGKFKLQQRTVQVLVAL